MTQIDSRRLQRRNNLRQTEAPSQMMRHTHAYWSELNYTLFAGGEKYTTSSYCAVGAKVYLNPVVLMYVVKAELVTTATFAGTPDNYTIQLSLGSNDYEYQYDGVLAYENVVTDITTPMQVFFKIFREEEVNISVKVSNAASSITLFGSYLRFTTYQEDSYGDYENVVSPMLIDDSDIDKSYIRDLDEESKSFEYISGIKPL